MRSDHREKKEVESQKTNWRSDLAPFVFSTKSWRVKSATQRVSFVIVFPKNVLGQKKTPHTLMSKHERCFFCMGTNPWANKESTDFKITQTLHLIRVRERHPPHFPLFQFDISIWFAQDGKNQCREQIRSPRTGYWCVCEHPLCECRPRMRMGRGRRGRKVFITKSIAHFTDVIYRP